MSTEKKRKEGTGHGVDTMDRQKVEPPKKFKVILHNDDFTPMDLSLSSLWMLLTLVLPRLVK